MPFSNPPMNFPSRKMASSLQSEYIKNFPILVQQPPQNHLIFSISRCEMKKTTVGTCKYVETKGYKIFWMARTQSSLVWMTKTRLIGWRIFIMKNGSSFGSAQNNKISNFMVMNRPQKVIDWVLISILKSSFALIVTLLSNAIWSPSTSCFFRTLMWWFFLIHSSLIMMTTLAIHLYLISRISNGIKCLQLEPQYSIKYKERLSSGLITWSWLSDSSLV